MAKTVFNKGGKETMTKTILALIHNGNLSDNELVVASGIVHTALHNQIKDAVTFSNDNDAVEWYCGKKRTEAFQTSKDLKTLEKQFKEKNMAVYLHEKEIDFSRYKHPEVVVCEVCGERIEKNIEYFLFYPHSEYVRRACQKCKDEIQRDKRKKPLMLAVFGGEEIIKEMV